MNLQETFSILVPKMNALGWKLTLEQRTEYDPTLWKAVWWRNAFNIGEASEADYGFAKDPDPAVAIQLASEIALVPDDEIGNELIAWKIR